MSRRPLTPTQFAAIVAAQGFALGIKCDDDWLHEIYFLPPQREQAALRPLAMEAARQLRAYLKNADFCFNLPLRPSGTQFQRRVWEAVNAIPRGQPCTYGELAKRLHSAPRAVGQACGANPFPLVIPCHRVVASSKGLNKGLGGFAKDTGGLLLDIKRWLLTHEGS